MPSEDGNINKYEQRRLANIQRNKRRLANLSITKTLDDIAQQHRPKKTAKKKHNPRIATSDPPNLRPRQPRNYAQLEQEDVVRATKSTTRLDLVGDFLTNNEGTTIFVQQLIYDIPGDAYNWFMRTAGRKWKDFKAKIKKKYFRPEINIEEVTESPDSRINISDWKFLLTYWLSGEFQGCSEIAKENRAKLELHHASGSVSYACSRYDLAVELGRPPRRDENFIKTHTRKNGLASGQAAPIINQLKEIVETCPELKERTIQEGDAFATVCGEKEPRGYVRVMGLGPTPQDLHTPGLKNYAPTRLQMEIFARKKLEEEKTALQQRVAYLENKNEFMEERVEHERTSVEPQSQHDSTSHQHNTYLPEIGDAAQDEGFEDYASTDDEEEDCRSHEQYATQSKCHSQHDALVGKVVILYALLHSDHPVAKGTIVSTRPTTMVGGQALGREFCEVVVTCILKRDAILPRPYDDMNTMVDADMMSIAWPYKKLKICKKASSLNSSGSIGNH